MATDNIVGALESMVAECRLKQDFVERCRDIRQASHLRYGHLPLSFLSRGGAEQHNGFNAAGTALPKLRRSNAVHHHQDNQPDTPPVLEAVVATKRQKKWSNFWFDSSAWPLSRGPPKWRRKWSFVVSACARIISCCLEERTLRRGRIWVNFVVYTVNRALVPLWAVPHVPRRVRACRKWTFRDRRRRGFSVHPGGSPL